MNDHDKKRELLVHVIIGENDNQNKSTRETKGGVFRGTNSRTNKTRLDYFVAWKRKCLK